MKTMTKWITVAAMAMAVSAAMAVPLIDWQDATPSRLYTGWTTNQYDGLGAAGAAINTGTGNAGVTIAGRQAIQVTSTTNDLPQAITLATTYFQDDLTAYPPLNIPVAGVKFDFYAPSEAPTALGFFFQSGVNYWYYDINPANIIIGQWQMFSAPLFFAAGWYGFPNDDFINNLGAGQFATDLAAVDRMGLYVIFDPDYNQSFGIYEYGLTIPEPETYVVLGIALISVAFVFRKKISDSLADARAMIRL